MTFKNLFKDFINVIVDKYNSIKTANQQISTDFKDLFQHNANSLDKLVYQSSGVVGLCDDIVDNGRTTFDKIYNIRKSISKLEDIIFNRKNSNVYSSSDFAVLTRPSKLKSLFISTIVGVGTMNYAYNTLRSSGDVEVSDGIDIQKNYVYSPETLSSIIELKNKYFWKTDSQLRDVVQRETNHVVNNFNSLIKDAMKLKITNQEYSSIARINYDSQISSQDMKQDFIRAYYSSDKTLKELSKDFEKKHGMYISASTISVNARKYFSSRGLDFKNRREAKLYYSKIL
jgi:hypothetical protein